MIQGLGSFEYQTTYHPLPSPGVVAEFLAPPEPGWELVDSKQVGDQIELVWRRYRGGSDHVARALYG